MAVSKSPVALARPVEGQRRLEIAVGDRPAERPARERREDLRGARQSLRARRLVGRQTKIRFRLGVSLSPAGLNGPTTSRLPTLGIRSSPPPGLNEYSTSSDSAYDLATKVTPTLCGPAVTLTGMFWKRPLMAATAGRLLLIDRLQVFLAADLRLEAP